MRARGAENVDRKTHRQEKKVNTKKDKRSSTLAASAREREKRLNNQYVRARERDLLSKYLHAASVLLAFFFFFKV